MQDSGIAPFQAQGIVDQKRLQNYAQGWGKLSPKEQAKAMAELTRDMPPRYREVIENYFKKVAQSQPTQP
jgi:hypothetical protein